MYEIFGPYLTDFMLISLDDLSVFGGQLEHLKQLRLCFLKCRQVHFSLNPMKCAFAVPSGRLLGYIISAAGISVESKGIFVNPDKVAAIMQATTPSSSKEYLGFLGQIGWHGRHLRFSPIWLFR